MELKEHSKVDNKICSTCFLVAVEGVEAEILESRLLRSNLLKKRSISLLKTAITGKSSKSNTPEPDAAKNVTAKAVKTYKHARHAKAEDKLFK